MAELTSLSARGRFIRGLARPLLRQVVAASARLERLDNDDLIRAGVLSVGRHVYGRPRVLVWSARDTKALAGSRVQHWQLRVDRKRRGDLHWRRAQHQLGDDLPNSHQVRFGRSGSGRAPWDTWGGNDWKRCLDWAWGAHPVRIQHRRWRGHWRWCRGRRGSSPVWHRGGRPGARDQAPLHTDDEIGELLSIRWWDWPDEKVIEEVGDLCGPGISAFVEKHGRSRDGLHKEA